ncbi:MAG: type II secretion system F family protein [Betaproteobacteria bacterium]|nr:type II secretion system F family protein [Betaproteobacteria bacterium]
MPSFSYKGRSASGELVKGVIEGATAAAAAELLFGQGITPLDITPAKEASGGVGSLTLGGLFKEKVTQVDLLLFSRQLYTLLKAGVPILRALSGLQESSTSKAMKTVLQEIRASLESGRELSVSLARQPRVFSAFYLAMVRVGEFTGRLEDVFLSLFHHLEFERFMRDQVKSALRYPSFVVAAMAIAIVIVNIFVIPAFAKVFAGFGTQLPLMTRILIGFSNFMVSYWYLMALALVLAFVAFRSWVGTESGRYQWDRIKLKIPVAGKIVQKATLARFSRSFALAIRSGVPIVQAMAVVSQTVDNAYIADKVDKMRDGVERGDSILRTAIATGVFTPVVIQMIAVGEESGSLEDMMQEIAEMYQNEVEYELKTLGQQIEPILIVFLGILVLILALGIFLPIWDLGRAAIKR